MVPTQYRVLFLSSWYPTREKPTMGNFVQKHAEAVSRYARVDVLHVCFSEKNAVQNEWITEEKGNLIRHIVYLKKTSVRLPLVREIVKLWKIVRAYQKAYKQIYVNEKPDIIHANILIPVSLIAYIFAVTKKIPYIITEHWTGFLPGDPNKPGRSMLFFRHFANKAACLSPVTMNLATAMQSFGIRNKFTIVPNVVDTDTFRIKEKIPNEKKRILHVSSLLDVQKNFSGLLLALGELKHKGIDFILEVISDGDFEQYQKKIETLNLKQDIVFHGKKNTSEVAAIMQHCDLLLLCSHYENFPCVIPEAWACGLPVLSTNVGGISEYMTTDNGMLIAPHDSNALSTALEKMLNNIQNYDQQKIRDFALQHFSYDVIGRQFIEIYQQLLKK